MTNKVVYSSEHGDLRKNKDDSKTNGQLDENSICLHLRRLTSGKGRTIIEITNLPEDKAWCKALSKDIKKRLGVGGAYKKNFIEIHGEKMDEVMKLLEAKRISFKKIGG